MSVAVDVDRLEKKCAAMEEALGNLVRYYVANLGSPDEFISCITPRHASQLSAKDRSKDDCWSKWDAARKALGWPIKDGR